MKKTTKKYIIWGAGVYALGFLAFFFMRKRSNSQTPQMLKSSAQTPLLSQKEQREAAIAAELQKSYTPRTNSNVVIR